MGRAKKQWVQRAFAKNPGALRKTLHVAKDKTIPKVKLEKATHSKNPLTRKRAILAETAKNFNHRKGK
jgi:hypothetical protein